MSRSGSQKRRRQALLAVRLTDSEMNDLRAHADRRDQTVPEFVRGLIAAAVVPLSVSELPAALHPEDPLTD